MTTANNLMHIFSHFKKLICVHRIHLYMLKSLCYVWGYIEGFEAEDCMI